ncbi:MAG: virulence protein [Hominilimicola sp.]
MEIKYNLTGADRKALVKAVSDIVGEPSKYLGAPSFAYQIGDWYTITRNGTLEISEYADSEQVERLREKLYEQGFEAENDAGLIITETDSEDEDFESKTVGYSIGLPIVKLSDKPCSDKIIANLKAIIAGKMTLFQKAVGTDKELKVEWDRDTIWFDWFDEMQDAEKAEYYFIFFKALYQMAEKAVRVTAKEKPVENEKFAMRTFLNRIGLSGKEYKPLRKELMKNLSGDGAFRYGRPEKNESKYNSALDGGAKNEIRR